MAVDGRPNGHGRGDRGVVAAAPTRLDHQKRLENPGAAAVSRGGLVGDKGRPGVAVHAGRGKSRALSPRLLSIWSRIRAPYSTSRLGHASPEEGIDQPPFDVRVFLVDGGDSFRQSTAIQGSVIMCVAHMREPATRHCRGFDDHAKRQRSRTYDGKVGPVLMHTWRRLRRQGAATTVRDKTSLRQPGQLRTDTE